MLTLVSIITAMKRKKRLASPEHFDQIAYVMTLPRACEFFYVSRASVMNAINTDRIAAVKEHGIWLISFNSALEYYRPGVLAKNK